jgi:DNA topoisomerase-2
MQSSSSDQDLANVYQQKTDKQHILDNPDTYIGSVENVDASMWIYDNETKKIALNIFQDYINYLMKVL